MKITKKVLALILTAALVVGTAACGAGAETASQPSSVPTSTATSEVSLNENKDFDFDAVCKDIEINGKKYTFPFSLDDLGEGYTFDNIRYLKADEKGEKYTVYADVMYNEEIILIVSIDNVAKEYYKKDEEITSIPINYISQDNWESSRMNKNTNYIKIAGLKIGNTNEDVKDKLGEPHVIIDDDNGNVGSYTYYKDNTKCTQNLCYEFDDYGNVSYIGIMG